MCPEEVVMEGKWTHMSLCRPLTKRWYLISSFIRLDEESVGFLVGDRRFPADLSELFDNGLAFEPR